MAVAVARTCVQPELATMDLPALVRQMVRADSNRSTQFNKEANMLHSILAFVFHSITTAALLQIEPPSTTT